MRWRSRLEIFAFLCVAFGGEILAIYLTPRSVFGGGGGSVVLDNLPFAVFGLGLWLAFRSARRVNREALARGQDQGLYCTKCGYDMRATPVRCPECGSEGTGKYILPLSKNEVRLEIVKKFIGVTIVALLTAMAVMVHTQAVQSGH